MSHDLERVAQCLLHGLHLRRDTVELLLHERDLRRLRCELAALPGQLLVRVLQLLVAVGQLHFALRKRLMQGTQLSIVRCREMRMLLLLLEELLLQRELLLVRELLLMLRLLHVCLLLCV